jgi:hypothetical protein
MKLLIGSAFVLVGLLLGNARAESVRGQTLEARVSAAVRNWRAIKPEFLRDPANHELLVALREKAKNPNQIEARVMLLNAEDSSVIERCLAELHEDNAYHRAGAARVFERCNQPKLIVRLADDLNRQEGAKAVKISAGEEVVRMTPISVLATQAILGIILNGSHFGDDVKAWASKVPARGFRDDEHDVARTSVRKWWEENEKLIRAERYEQARPPKS